MRARLNPPLQGVDLRFERHVAHRFFVRFHMSLILTAVIASGVLASKGLLELGVRSLRLRYPLAALGSYLVFVVLVRVWIWYVKICCTRWNLPGFSRSNISQGGSIDLGGGSGGSGSGGIGGSGSGSEFRGFSGGDSGGGGASSAWEAGAASVSEPARGSGSSSSSSSSWFGKLDLGGGGDGDGWLVLLLLGALVVAIVGAGGYLIWAAPHILPEAATQALLASTLARAARQQQHSWLSGVLRSTCIPFLVVSVLAWGLGWSAQRHCPTALRLADVFSCPVPADSTNR